MSSKDRFFNFLCTCCLVSMFVSPAMAQSTVTFEGGYISGSVENYDENISGFRIVAGFETQMINPHWIQGGSFSYLQMDGELTSTSKAKLTSLPLLYIPKYTIGSNKLKGYLKGAFGIHYSRVKWEGTVLGVETWNIDISLGAGAGGTYELSQKVLLFVDYELLWLNNSNFSEVLSHTVGLGVGIML